MLWLALLAVVVLTGWIASVILVNAISFYTVIVQHLTAAKAARVERHQQEGSQ